MGDVSFALSAVWTAVEIGLLASDVLSTLFKANADFNAPKDDTPVPPLATARVPSSISVPLLVIGINKELIDQFYNLVALASDFHGCWVWGC